MPLITRSQTSTQVSLVPSSLRREYVLKKVISPTLLPAASEYPQGTVLPLYELTKSSANLKENKIVPFSKMMVYLHN
jgi:hypothetical protein